AYRPASAPSPPFFFFTVTPPPELSPLSLHDALPISSVNPGSPGPAAGTMVLSICGGTSIDMVARSRWSRSRSAQNASDRPGPARSEEHTSELQSLTNLVCRLLLEKKKIDLRPTSRRI